MSRGLFEDFDCLILDSSVHSQATSVGMRRRGIIRAVQSIQNALIDMNEPLEARNPESLFEIGEQALAHMEQAGKFGLFTEFGIPPISFVALAIMHLLLRPTLYVESGVFRGASMYAATVNPKLEKMLGFDPQPQILTPAPFAGDKRLEQITHDFGVHDFSGFADHTKFLHLDDHINVAERIISAHEAGLKLIVLDDLQGLTHTVRTRWPGMPSLYFVEHANELEVGDFIQWRSEDTGLKVVFDEMLIERCCLAKSLVHKITPMPPLLDDLCLPNGGKDCNQTIICLK